MTPINEIDFGRGQEAILRKASLREIIRLREATDPTGQTPCRTIVRFIYYRLVANNTVVKDSQCIPQPGINPRTGKPYKSAKLSSDRVSGALTWLREQGWVLDPEIVDQSRSTAIHTGFKTIKEGLLSYLEIIPLDPWDENPPVVAVESRSLQAFFDTIASDYRVNVICLGGQSSRGYLANDAANKLGKYTLVLYVGDYDKAGHDIENSAKERLRELAPHWLATDEHWGRVAVTDEQFQEYGVNQGLAISKFDDRFSPPREFETLEAEGVEQGVLEASVRDALEALLPVDLDDIRQEEQRQREQAERRINRWRI